MNNAIKKNRRASAASLVQHSRNMQFYGFNQLIKTDSNGNGISEYVILDTNGKEWELRGTYTVDMETEEAPSYRQAETNGVIRIQTHLQNF